MFPFNNLAHCLLYQVCCLILFVYAYNIVLVDFICSKSYWRCLQGFIFEEYILQPMHVPILATNCEVLLIRSSSGHSKTVSLEVGGRFCDGEHFKNLLRNYAIQRNFNFMFIKNDKQRVTIHCAFEGCQWRVHTSKEDNYETYRIKTIYPTHPYVATVSTQLCKSIQKIGQYACYIKAKGLPIVHGY